MYNEFADIYDYVMRDVPYDQWVSYYQKIFKAFHLNPSLILDLGCGTGNVTARMAKAGYDMIGLDSSVSMLSKAKQKNSDILYLHMDMTDFELYGTVDAMISALDCVNYIQEGIDKLFSLVYNYLNFGGIFIFDINTPYKFQHVFGKEPIICDEDDIYYVWENETENHVCHFYLTFFIRRPDGGYDRYDEYQTERIYSVDEITAAAESAGLKVCAVYDDLTFSAPRPDSERIFFVVSKEK